MNKIPKYTKSLVFLILIACVFMTTGCSTFVDIPNSKEIAEVASPTGKNEVSAGERFYRRNNELIEAVENSS